MSQVSGMTGGYSYAGADPINNVPADAQFVAGWTFSDYGHLALDFAGLIPVVGEVFDVINAVWYLGEGDYVNAGLSGAAALPFLGWAATGTKLGAKGISASVKAVKATKVSAAISVANTVQKGAQWYGTSTKAARALDAGVNIAESGYAVYSGIRGISQDPSDWTGYASVGMGVFGFGINGRAASRLSGGSVAAPRNVELPTIQCFAPDTLVRTPDGQRAIDEIRTGESVLAFDFERGEWVVRSVVERHDNYYDGPVITLRTSGGTVTTTAYHPFWVQEGRDLAERSNPRELSENEDHGLSLAGRWVNSHELRAGDVFVTNSGGTTRLLSIEQHYDPKFRVCNLTIETNHSFAVGFDSILVHNTPGCNRFIGSNRHAVAEALEHGDINIAGAVRAGVSRTPQHHIFSQKLFGKNTRQWFSDRGIDIDRITVAITQGEHEALHKWVGTADWNRVLRNRLLRREAELPGKLTARQIWEEGYRLLREVGIRDATFIRF